MRDSKLYKAIVQLSGHELNRLHRFILSPYFNRSESLINLFESIKNDLKSNKKEEPDKEKVWEVCFPNEPFNDGRFRKLQSDLLKLIEDYYAQETFESNPIHKVKFLLEAIHGRELSILKSEALRTAQKLAEEHQYKPSSYYYYQYAVEQSIYYLNRNTVERTSKSNIENIALNLDRFYLAEKLRYYCTILNHQHLALLDYEMLFIDEIISHVKAHDYSDIPPIIMYYQILLTYKEPDIKEHYYQLKLFIQKYIHLFPEFEVKEIIDAALNYGIKRMNAGQAEFEREVFELYKAWLEKGWLQERQKIDPFHFKNIVTAGLRSSEFEWVESFIEEYSPFLDIRFRNNAITFNLAQLFFYKKDYARVIRLLAQVEYEDMTYNLNSKTLLMASYYELDELEALGSLLDTFRVYLSRNKELPTTRRKHYLNTISIMRKLSKLTQVDSKEIDKLTREVEETQGVVSKNWILEKLAALRG